MRMWMRLLIVCLRAFLRRKPGSAPDQPVLSFRVMTWDCVLRYMGNDRYHSFMDLGRLDLAFRFGWINNLYKRGWQPQVVGCLASYALPLRLFDHFVLRTYVVHFNGVSVWLAHQFEKDGVVYHSALAKLVAVSRSQVVTLTSFFPPNKEKQEWSSGKNTERLFNQGKALLKELSSIPF